MICYSCGETIPDEATYCYHCGAVMPVQETLEDGVPLRPDYDRQREDIMPFDDILEPRRRRSSMPLVLAILAAGILVIGGIYFATRTNKEADDVRAKLSQLTFVNVSDTTPIVVTTPSQTAADTVSGQTGAASQASLPSAAVNLPTSAAPASPKPSAVSNYNAPSLPVYQAPVIVEPDPVIPDEPYVPEQGQTGDSYTVVAGDTYWSLATRFYGKGSQELVEKIAAANNRTSSDHLKVGEVITIPPLDDVVDSADGTPRADIEHTVVSGDSYWSLAVKYYGRGSQALAEKIAAANDRTSSDSLIVGEVITIPEAAVENTPQAPADPETKEQTYTVVAGDSYWTVSNKFYGEADHSLARLIAEANNRTVDDALKAGEVIIIPTRAR
jgi:nucleoid-associated protein YgaU